jgi:uncharacterized membrane protein
VTAPAAKFARYLHWFFEIGLLIKAVDAVIEIVAACAAVIVPPRVIAHLLQDLARRELTADPHDPIANYLLSWTPHLSVSSQHFVALYLLGHGIIKLWLIIGLLRARLWYYPVALVVFGLFIVYQLYRYSRTHSVWLLALTGIDLVVVALTWHEYRYLRQRRQPS